MAYAERIHPPLSRNMLTEELNRTRPALSRDSLPDMRESVMPALSDRLLHAPEATRAPPPPFSTTTIKAYGVSSSRRKPVNHAFGVLSAPTSAVPDFAQMSMPGKRS